MINYQQLSLAKSVAEQHDQLDAFLEAYSRARRTHGIHISLELALAKVGLWVHFVTELEQIKVGA
jgi:hypothetical protein